MELKQKVKKIRIDLGYSQRELGIAIGIPEKTARDHISDIELGRKRLIAKDYLKIMELAESQEQK